jgi:phage/plasmid-associated DNA primase
LKKDNINLARLDNTEEYSSNIETIKRLQEEIDEIELNDDDDDDEDRKCGDNNVVKNTCDPLFQDRMIELLKSYTIAHNGLKRLSNNVSRKAIAEVFMGILHINEIKWDDNPNLFAFKNCIMDLRTGEMIKPCKEQYIKTTCNWSWNYDYDMTKVENIQKLIESILPVKVVRDYYLLFNSTALTGHKVQKVPINTGTGGNGKSLCRELMTGVVGGYGMEIPSDVLTKPIVSGSPNPVLANMDMKRYLYFSEPEGNRPINSDTFKKLSGDRFISARGLYSSDTTVNMIASIAGDANTVPPFTNITQENAKSILRRSVITSFPTTAVTQEEYDLLENKTNYNVKKNYAEDKYWLDDNRQAMFMLLLEYTKEFI